MPESKKETREKLLHSFRKSGIPEILARKSWEKIGEDCFAITFESFPSNPWWIGADDPDACKLGCTLYAFQDAGLLDNTDRHPVKPGMWLNDGPGKQRFQPSSICLTKHDLDVLGISPPNPK